MHIGIVTGTLIGEEMGFMVMVVNGVDQVGIECGVETGVQIIIADINSSKHCFLLYFDFDIMASGFRVRSINSIHMQYTQYMDHYNFSLMFSDGFVSF